MTRPIRVLIVDDSAVMRSLLSDILSEDPEIQVVGTAPDPLIARDKIKALNPDVVTLDIEMPHMDGVSFLRKIMALRPTPVVMISTLTQAGAEVTLEALEIGAVDFVAKPSDIAHALPALSLELQTKVKSAAGARLRGGRETTVSPPKVRTTPRGGHDRFVFIGASTGGVEALKAVLVRLPADCPPILITQHMPPRFTAAFANRLNGECAMHISEAAHNDVVEPGRVYIAPGSHHLELAGRGGKYYCSLSDSAPVSGHRPSVDVLFRSAARLVGHSSVGAILTGMGKDGAEGLFELRQAGAITLGQDAKSSLIYGMPRAAFERGAVERQVSLAAMADAILDACESNRRRGSHGAEHVAARVAQKIN